MISTCPECNRSYPTHHGPICKMCAAKKSGTQAAKPAVTATTAPAAVQKPAAAQPQTTATRQTEAVSAFNPALGIYGDIPAHQDSSQAGNESVSKKKLCKHCSYPNNADDVFCASCKKMLESTGFKEQADYPLSEIKGIQTLHLSKLKELGISTTLALLEQGASPVKRKTLLIKSKISETFIVRMVNQADLLRIPQLEPDHAFLLEIIGINSVKSLEKKKAADIVGLAGRSKAILSSKGIYILPDEKLASKWVAAAGAINKLVS